MRKTIDHLSLQNEITRPGNVAITSETQSYRSPKQIEAYDKPAFTSPIQIGMLVPGKGVLGKFVTVLNAIYKKATKDDEFTKEFKKAQNLHDNLSMDRDRSSRMQSGIDRMESRERMEKIEGTGPTKVG